MDLIFHWDVRTWSRAYPLWHRALRAVHREGSTALALGERDGGLSLMLAEHGFTTVCSDLRGPTPQARELHRSRGLAHLIRYEEIDALEIRKPDNSMDVVAFKSMIGALGDRDKQRRAIQEMHRVLRPGGILVFAENLRGTALHQALRRRFVTWDHYWRYLQWPQDLELFSRFQQMEIRTTGSFANLGRSEWQRDVLARIDGLMLPLVPASGRTMVFGVATKGPEQ